MHPDLTGRENVYLNGAILGMSEAEIDERFDAIVDFSGIEKFIDTEVKFYSSGMYMRLAFSVAVHSAARHLPGGRSACRRRRALPAQVHSQDA